MPLQEWLAKIGVKTLYITSGSSWENGYCKSFNNSLRDELLNGELRHAGRRQGAHRGMATTLQHTVRPHSSLGIPSDESRGQAGT